MAVEVWHISLHDSQRARVRVRVLVRVIAVSVAFTVVNVLHYILTAQDSMWCRKMARQDDM